MIRHELYLKSKQIIIKFYWYSIKYIYAIYYGIMYTILNRLLSMHNNVNNSKL